MTRLRTAAAIVLVIGLAVAADARRRDPLTSAEIDQLRDVSQEPEKKLKLLVKFARARLLAIDQLRSDPRLDAGRGRAVHDLLEDFTTLVDEMDNNIASFLDRKDDIRKPLKELIEANTEFRLKLRALKEGSKADAKLGQEEREYGFTLTDAMEAVEASLESARTTLDKQNADWAVEKQAKKKK